ncbi:hypothetical protein, partial [Modestobacter roseus]|uniref:hypothetical protein n=1 Tax=Modestobacter roseus TaxID=1181884 RepID=UPI0012959106
MSGSESAIEKLLQRWEEKNPGTPVRPVVERAVDLGFTVAEPGTFARSLRLEYAAPAGRAVTLQVDARSLTAVGADVRDRAGRVHGAVVRRKDVQFPFDAVDPDEVLGVLAAATAKKPQLSRAIVVRAAAGAGALLFVVALLVGGTAASSETDADTASSGTEATAPATP